MSTLSLLVLLLPAAVFVVLLAVLAVLHTMAPRVYRVELTHFARPKYGRYESTAGFRVDAANDRAIADVLARVK